MSEIDDLRRRLRVGDEPVSNRGRVKPRVLPHGEKRRPEPHGVPRKRKGKGARRKRPGREKVNAEGPYQDFPKFFSKARFRERIGDKRPRQLGVEKLVAQNGSIAQATNYTYIPTTYIERCADELHPWIQSFFLRSNGYGRPTTRVDGLRFRPGGPLDLVKSKLPSVEVQGQGTYNGPDFRPFGGYLQSYTGGHVPGTWSAFGYNENDLAVNIDLIGPFGQDFADPSGYGASAYKRYAPKTSFADLAVTVAELREAPGMLMTSLRGFVDTYKAIRGTTRQRGPHLVDPNNERQIERLKEVVKGNLDPSSIGEVYVNTAFGWAPFINDFLKLYKNFRTFESRYGQIVRQNGNWIKRGGTILEVLEDSPVTTNTNGVYPTFVGGYYTSPLNYVETKYYSTVKRKVWFEGSYRYYIPGFDKGHVERGSYEYVVGLLRTSGLNITPSVIWELTPWTWLIDYFSNVGDVIDNFSRYFSDHLVTRYAHVMQHETHRLFNESTIHYKSGDVKCYWFREIEAKRRRSATPFGFGLAGTDLSVRQWAILGALGLSFGNDRGGPRGYRR